jgi:uncharacterized protein (UPF0332 family)
MSSEFQKALDKKKILKFPKGKSLVKKELKAAKDDLEEAQDRFKKKKYKYATITAYYSMFHSARALLYAKGYREKSHYWLIVAMQTLYVEKGLLDETVISEFHDAMVLREDADYHGKFSKEGAEVNIASAQEFLKKAKSILSKSQKRK